MKDQLLIQLVSEVKKDPSFMKHVIDGCIYGVLENNKETNNKLIKSEKATFMLLHKDMTVLHNEGNFQDVADSLNSSHFINTQKYSKEDIAKLF